MELKKETAKKLYDNQPDWFKEQLEEAFGKNCFRKKSFEDIKTFEDAYAKMGVNPEDILNANDTPDETAYKKLKVIIRAINQGWIPDWNNIDQYKWWPYFNSSSGFGFSGTTYYYGRTGATVGSRLCFESEEKSKYAATQFLDLYRVFLT